MEHTVQVNNTTLTVDPQGAWVTSLRDDKGDILFSRQRLENSSGETKLRGGCHVCVPQFGPSLEGVGLAQHGFGRDSLWTLEETSGSTVKFGLLSGHPDYQAMKSTLSYTLEKKSLTMELVLQNDGSSELRIAPAFHPYFATGDAASLELDGQTVNPDEYQDTEFVRGSSKSIDLKDRTIKLRSNELNVWALWSDRLGDYFCVEPTLGGNRFLEPAPQFDERLSPNSVASYRFTISW